MFAGAARVAHANVYKLAGVPFKRGKMEKKTLEDLTQEEKADVESVLSRIRDTAGKLSVTVDAAVKGFSVERHAETYAYMGVVLPQEPLPAGGLTLEQCALSLKGVEKSLDYLRKNIVGYARAASLDVSVIEPMIDELARVYAAMDDAYTGWAAVLSAEYCHLLDAIETLTGQPIQRSEREDLEPELLFGVASLAYEVIPMVGMLATDASMADTQKELKQVKKELDSVDRKLLKWRADSGHEFSVGRTMTSAVASVRHYVASKRQ